ncbi:MAG: lysophospholipid acyltransferase family protein [Bdellovibrionaceae bacterium]|nr:lysophospholipid acyltransferase family protein [Pseudobdellovibrionaceae bacterium]MBX3033670.1 lysophospholipid acyltransferase family protein [Pseudobdellovibrionaceae bacterium]
MKAHFAGFLIYLLYQSFRFTWRITLIEPESLKARLKEKKPFILAHWHGDELALIQLASRYRIGTIVSQSKDGQLMNTVLRLLGARTTRGSSTRGGIGALKGLLRMVREGNSCSFAVDGPKGPIYKVKPGVFEVAKLSGLPIYWSGVACDRAFHFPKSWNKTYLPKPFARLRIEWHGPFRTLTSETDPKAPELAQTLEQDLHAAKQQALAAIAEA